MAYKRISPIIVTEGGSGAQTFNANGVVISNTTTTGALASLALTDGQIVIGSSAGAPAAATITAGSGITVTNGHNAITIAASGSGISTLSGDSGSATGSTVTISTGLSSNLGGQTLSFSGSSSTLSLNVNDGNGNIFIGKSSGKAGYSGLSNTAVGVSSLTAITSGSGHTAFGNFALNAVTNGIDNTGVGANALTQLTTGSYNTATGWNAGGNYTGSESSNICIGYGVGGTASESNTLRIGNGTGTGNGNLNVAIICGINGKTSTSGVAVLVNSSNILGTTTSSRRFKKNIKDMGDLSSRIFDLRPVIFNYKEDGTHVSEEDSHVLQYGLIAEEVIDIIPEMVVYNQKNEIETLRYQHLAPMLLNELQKAVKRIEVLEKKLEHDCK